MPGIERIRAFDLSQLPAPPIARLLGIRAGHVGPGSGTWIMPATGWSLIESGELEVSKGARWPGWPCTLPRASRRWPARVTS